MQPYLSIYPYHLPPADELTPGQKDGIECVYCPGGDAGTMRPVGHLRGTMLFAHTGCADENRMENH
ncbi:hypothetical protein ABT096_29540 [Streptomyces sp. NPDC002561]|uniref:hypothetical protein n=1 Tax=Streptomyces sp. NPDC002561 TaxID=3154418 RepID=UPI0033223244